MTHALRLRMTIFYLAHLSGIQHAQSRNLRVFQIRFIAISLVIHSLSATGATGSANANTKSELRPSHRLEFYGETTATSADLPPASAFVARGQILPYTAPYRAPNSASAPKLDLTPYLLAGADSFSGGFAGAGAASQLPKLDDAPGLYGSMRIEFRMYESEKEQWLLAASGESTHQNRTRITGDLWGIHDETSSASLQIRAAADAIRHPRWVIGGGGGQRWTSWATPSPFVFGEARVTLMTFAPSVSRHSSTNSSGTWATLLGKQFLNWPRQTEWTLAIGGAL